jgi:hypothetical protein
MERKMLGYLVIVFVVVGFITFVISTQISGVPLWWVFRGLVPLSVVETESRFKLIVSPETPMEAGDDVLVTVRNASDQMPVEGAKVSLLKNGDHIHDYYTNASGQVIVEYVGEVTIIEISKTGFKTMLEAIPQSPIKWVIDHYISIGIGAISGFASAITTHIFRSRKKH